MKRKFK